MEYLPKRSILSLLLLSTILSISACSPQDGSSPAAAEKDAVAEDAAPTKPEGASVPQELFLQAALDGDLETVLQALAGGTAADSAGPDGRTALMLASFNGHSAVVASLIAQHADVNSRDSIGRTALMYASTAPNDDTVDLLLSEGADIDAVDQHEHWTALMFAAAEGCEGVVEILLDRGADASLKDIDGDTAADFARQRGHGALADSIQKRIGPEE